MHQFWILMISAFLIISANEANCQRTKNKNNKELFRIESTSELKCDNQTYSTLDISLYKLLDSKFPTINRELRIFCNQGYKTISYVQSFIKQCLPEFSQKVVSVVFFPIRRELSAICKTGRTSSKAKELMKAAKCGNAARPGLRKCYRKFIESELAVQQVNGAKRIPMICCAFNRLRDCFKQEAEEVKECTARTVDYVERWATEIYGEIMDLMCYEYPQASDKCDKVLLEIPKINLVGLTVPKSFLSPLMAIVSDLGAEDASNLKD